MPTIYIFTSERNHTKAALFYLKPKNNVALLLLCDDFNDDFIKSESYWSSQKTEDKEEEAYAPLLFRLPRAQNRSPLREKKTKKKKTVGTDWKRTTKTLRRKRRQTNDTTRSSGRKNCTATSNVSKLENTHVVIIGIGGIGSWCAEALARTSIGEFTLIDLDFICVTNINRQTMAMESTVGESKVFAMKKRILDVNKHARGALRGRFCE